MQDLNTQCYSERNGYRYLGHKVPPCTRVGAKQEGRCRPIIACFISRQDRDLIWQNRGKIKNSDNYPDAYITEDFARAIQLEKL